MEKLLRIGHSPDADDAFMFYAIAHGLVPLNGFHVEHVIEDIQSLNQRALRAELEVTAVSAAVYPSVADRYWVLSCGASVGRNYGPIVVAKRSYSIEELQCKKIAVPGVLTTAYALARIFLPTFEPVVLDFTKVIPAVLEGRADAGVIIHEGQLNYGKYDLCICADFGKIWHEKYGLPIPLGLDVVRKDLGMDSAKKIKELLNQSIRMAIENENEALDYALKFGRGISKETAREFVRMYVNEDTLDLGAEGIIALNQFFQAGHKAGLFQNIPTLKVI